MRQVLKMTGIHKSFGSLNVLKNIRLNLYAGEVMALMGENGAGKSTLMKILGGIEPYDQGNIEAFGRNYRPRSVIHAESHGIVMIHQELNLFDELTVLDNIFFGCEIMKNRYAIDYKKQLNVLNDLFDHLDIYINPHELVKNLSIGQKQLIEITKALRKNAKILVMDEPTSALSDDEIQRIFCVIRTLKEKGTAIIYISHRMQEIYHICDRVTILRDGEYMGEHGLSDLAEDRLIEMMVGRDISDPFPYVKAENIKPWLTVENLSGDFVKNARFTLHRGEILGVGGLMGSGRTSLAHLLFGIEKIKSGSLSVDGKQIRLSHPRDAINHNIIYISEDRKGNGLWLNFSIGQNISMPSVKLFTNKLGHIRLKKEEYAVKKFMDWMHVKAADPFVSVGTLSGGNQQKVAIARALLAGPLVLILDEPTRGIDIGARREIYNMINDLKKQGTAIILISSDMPELISLSDRILVMAEGQMTGLLDTHEKTPENVMKLAVKLKEAP